MFFLIFIVGHKTSLVVGENWCFVSDLYDVNNQPTVELRCTLRARRYQNIARIIYCSESNGNWVRGVQGFPPVLIVLGYKKDTGPVVPVVLRVLLIKIHVI
jgi:hypothetical protein